MRNTVKFSDKLTQEENEFIFESNCIESEYSQEAFDDAVKAWQYLKTSTILSTHVILCAHMLLMENRNKSVAGRLRHYHVRVGNYLAPDPADVHSLLTDWVDEVMQWVQFGRVSGDNIDETAKYHHIKFESIHPFGDGNGRIGRMLMNWFLLKGGRPLMVIHEGEEQYLYYNWFK